MNIKKNDNVIVLAGKDKGKKGKVLVSLPTEARVVVEGVNVRNRRTKPRKSNEKGQVVAKPSPIAISNVAIVCSSCGKGTRVKMEVVKGKKTRMCAKCGKAI